MRRTSFVIACLFLAGLLTSGAGTASAQTSDALFDPNTLQEIHLFVNTRDLAQLRATYQLNTRYPADMQWGTTRVRNVSIRSRGSGSRSGDKIGLLIEFDRYTTGQQFLGLTSLVLKNLRQDESMMRERLAMAFFARMGFPASRESYGKVYINNEYQGVYGFVENVDPAYLTRVFGEHNGYLYEYRWPFVYLGTDLGDDLTVYKNIFEARTRTLESDATVYPPIRNLFKEINGPDDNWKTNVGRYIDLNYIVTYVAIEGFLSEWDGFAGNYGMNNFFMYRKSDSTQLQVLPWDRDNAMLYSDSSIFFHNDDNELIRRALLYPDLHELFLQTIETCVQKATEDDWMAHQADSIYSLIREAVYQDLRKPYTNVQFEDEVTNINAWIALRPATVRAQVAADRGSLPY